MFIWQKQAAAKWLRTNERLVRELAGTRLAVVSRPDRKRITLEVGAPQRDELTVFQRCFGGAIRRLPGGWQGPVRNTIKVGSRLTIVTTQRQLTQAARRQSYGQLLIPVGAAFGTGQHATTAMSLRLLEQISRSLSPGWRMLDLGTGTGILALAARRFGAHEAMAIDSDPIAISVAAANARLNRIDRINFCCADVRELRPLTGFEVTAANLFSELFMSILPNLRHSRYLISSGILRGQEGEVDRALRRNRFTTLETRRRGKWIALLAQKRG